MAGKLIIGVRANEYTMRDHNPYVSWSPEELARDAAECREAGAASYHFHARGTAGQPDHSHDTYRAIMSAIRERSDILLQPTLGGSSGAAEGADWLQTVVRLEQDALQPDFAPLDMGSTNADIMDPGGTAFHTENRVYANSTATLRELAGVLRGLGVKPYLHVWNIPQLRLASVFHGMGVLDGPLWVGLSHSGDGAPIHHPATVAGLLAYLAVLPRSVPVVWSANAYAANLLALASTVLDAGGHLALGIGDHPYTELDTPTNAEPVRHAAVLARRHGRDLASPAEAKQILGIY